MNFLILRGIPLRQKQSLIFVDTHKEEIYNQLPKTYDPKTWPKSTNMPCYMCTIVTKRIPFFVPSIITSDGVVHRGNNPHICAHCAMNWIMENANDESEKRRYTSYVIELIRQMTGYHTKVLNKAFDRSELQKYGGTLTEHQFIREMLLLSEDYMIKMYDSYQDYENDLS